MGSQVLPLRCGKAAAVLVTCKHRDSAAEAVWFQAVWFSLSRATAVGIFFFLLER